MEPISSIRRNSLLISFGVLGLLVHLAVNVTGGYGYFRDELYYIACSDHLDWGYVDHPPLSIFILKISRLLFGDSIFALRLVPSLVAGVIIYLTGLMSRELGGGKFAQSLSCIGALASPILLGMCSIYQMNCFDYLFWALAAYVLVLIFKTDRPNSWIWLGVVLGLGLLNKIDVLWLGLGIFLGLVLTPQRSWLRTKWPWLAASLALLLFLPYILWNIAHGLPHLEFISNARMKYSSQNPLTFVSGQLLLQNPVNIPLWIAGLWLLLFSKDHRKFQVLGYTYVVGFVVLLVNGHSKAEYLSPAYTALFAGGGVAFESWLSGQSFRWVRVAYPSLIVASGLMMAPFALPILPVETYIRYAALLGMGPTTPEGHRLDKLPQFYADMFGWEDMTEAVAKVYQGLSKEDQARCGIYATNYGEAGAIDFFGKRYGLPKAASGHNSYFLWGTRGWSGEVLIIIGGNPEGHREVFESVEQVGVTFSQYAIPYENNRPIYLCRKLKVPLDQVWPRTKEFI